MQTAETLLAIYGEEKGSGGTNQRIGPLESRMTRKCQSGSEGGGWKRMQPVTRHG